MEVMLEERNVWITGVGPHKRDLKNAKFMARQQAGTYRNPPTVEGVSMGAWTYTGYKRIAGGAVLFSWQREISVWEDSAVDLGFTPDP